MEIRWEWGNALELPYADDRFDAATVGFGARNFSDLDRGLAEMARVVRPGGKVVVLEITTPTSRRCRRSTGCGSTASCRSSGASPARPRPTPTCRTRSSASRGPRGSPRRWRAPACATSAGSSRRAGSSPSTWDPYQSNGVARPRHRGHRVRAARPGAAGPRRDAPGHARGGQWRRARPARPATTIAAGGKRLRPLLVAIAAGDQDGDERRARRRRGRARPLGDARPRRRARRRRAAPRPPHGRRRGGREIATATGDLLFARAFAELAGGDRREAVRVLSDASSSLARASCSSAPTPGTRP